MGIEEILYEVARPFTSWANQLLIGLLLFLIGRKFRRGGLPAFLALGVGYLVFFNFFNYVPGLDGSFLRWGWFDFRTVIAFVWLVVLAFACFCMDIWHALFISVMSWTIQQFVFYIALLVGVGSEQSLYWFGIYILLLAVFYPLFYFFLIRKLVNLDDILRNKRAIVLISLFSVIIFQIITSYMAYDEDANANWLGLACIVLMLTVEVGFLGLNRMEGDKILMEQLMRESQRQSEVYRTNVEIINRKCHDLRHILGAAQSMTEQERAAGVAEISDAIRAYDSIFHTGNETLDNVLSEKQFYCNAHGIRLSCLVSGKDFAFMDKVDLYSLFGNALDNAIEYLIGVEDAEKRVILVSQEKWLNFLKLEFSNYCGEAVRFEGGLPVTNKADKNYHGYGTRSIRYIAEKYGAKCVMRQEGESFTVQITFRLREEGTN